MNSLFVLSFSYALLLLFVHFAVRHADLLATDVSEDDAVKYIDRFLMFYIATADRLQRTSTWMDKLEGGTHDHTILCMIVWLII